MKKTFFLCALLLAGISANAQLVVDMTTGKDNTTGTQIVCNNYEDSWELLTASGYVWPIVSDGTSNVNGSQVWAVPYNSCGKWINSLPTANCGLNYMPQQGGAHEFKLTFNNNAGCGLTNARFEFDAIGVDNSIYFELNNNLVQYHVNSTLSDCMPTTDNFTTLNTSGIIVSINPAHILPGVNVLRAYVCNNNRNSGMYICGSLKADYLPDPNLIPTITGPTVFCSGSPIVVNGSSATSNVTWHFWEMIECNSSAVVTPGGYVWSGFYSGAPSGNFSIPNSATAPCGKYYRIKLALNNACTAWSETCVLVSLVCTPAPVITGPATLCYGQQGTYCVSGGRGSTYQWSTGSTTACTTITPMGNTTLTVSVTNASGCTGTTSFPVTLYNTNPDFTLSSTLYSGYFTCLATPLVTTGLPPGFGHAWMVEEVSGPPGYSSVPNTMVNNPAIGCWWPMTCNFTGYNGTSTYPATCPSGNPPGQMTAGHYYRITRGTWSTNCGWQQISKVVFMCSNCRGESPVVIEEDNSAPSYEYLSQTNPAAENQVMNFTVQPNPSNGNVTLLLDRAVENGTVEIYSLTGEKVDERTISGTNIVQIDKTGLSKGIYLIRINTGGMTISKKMIIE